MPDKMLRVAARSKDGKAKALQSSSRGGLETREQSRDYMVMDRSITIQPGESFSWPLEETLIGKTVLWVSNMDASYRISYSARQSLSGLFYSVEIVNSMSHGGLRRYNFPVEELPTLPAGLDADANNIVIENTGSEPIRPSVVISSMVGGLEKEPIDIMPDLERLSDKNYERDVDHSSISELIDVIGEENIVLLLDMKTDSDGKYTCLLRKDISFTLRGDIGNVTNVPGPLGNAINIPQDNNTRLEEDPVIEGVISGSEETYRIQNEGEKLAVKINGGTAARVKRMQLRLRKTGSPRAFVHAQIHYDDNGKPGEKAHSMDYLPNNFKPKNAMSLNYMNNSSTNIGLALDEPVDIDPNREYWLVISLLNVETLDDSNNLRWMGGNGDNSIAFFDGSDWVVTENKTLGFSLYSDILDLKGRECTIIATGRSSTQKGMFLETRQKNEESSEFRDFSMGLRDGVTVFGVSSVPYTGSYDGHREHPVYNTTKGWASYALSVASKWSLNRFDGYVNGVKLVTGQATQADGSTGLGLPERSEPWIIGVSKNTTGSVTSQPGWNGDLGPFLIVNRHLSPAEIAKVHSILFKNRSLLGGE